MMTTRPSTLARLRAGALFVALTLLLASCYSRGALDHQAALPDTRPYYCSGVGRGSPPVGHAPHAHDIYEGMEKGPLSWEDCRELSAQLDLLIDAVSDLPTAGDAEAAGWIPVVPYIEGLGTHHMAPGSLPGIGERRPFDPTKPTFLIYGSDAPDSPLIGVAYDVTGADKPPPEAFAGTNDWWHLHTTICSGPSGILAGGEEIPNEECAALGGQNLPVPNGGHWLLHLWMMEPYQTKFDIFVSGHPCLGETGPLPWEDACWETYANHDPADGPLPGSEHDDEHGH